MTGGELKRQRGRAAYRKGLSSESLAALWLRLKAYRILARRYKTPCGEIDIIARKGGIIAIIEIKARPNLREAMEAVPPAAQRRIEAAANLWRARQADCADVSLRFDLIAICPRKLPQHIKAFFTA